jgi:hypothetical protein
MKYNSSFSKNILQSTFLNTFEKDIIINDLQKNGEKFEIRSLPQHFFKESYKNCMCVKCKRRLEQKNVWHIETFM